MAASVPYDPQRTGFTASDVALVAEVVPAEFQDRDRRYEPTLYAGAGIRYMWRIEDEQGLPVIHTYERDDATGTYVPTGVHRDRLATSVPFALVLAPADLAR